MVLSRGRDRETEESKLGGWWRRSRSLKLGAPGPGTRIRGDPGPEAPNLSYDPNGTWVTRPEGKANNRRVEFHIIKEGKGDLD